jgi:hypothetical protein
MIAHIAAAGILLAVPSCDPVEDPPAADLTSDEAPSDAVADPEADTSSPDIEITIESELTADVPPEQTGNDANDADSDVCIPDCEGKQCGPDGCGDYCGQCGCTGSDPMWGCEEGYCNYFGCCTDCTGKACGPDGCGGLCGYCDDPAKPLCSDALAECVAIACSYPASWGKVGAMDDLWIPGTDEQEFIETQCPDYSGDGKGDNGLKSIASTINNEMKKLVEGNHCGVLFEFRAVTDFASTPSFTLAILGGQDDPVGGDACLVRPQSYSVLTPAGECDALVAFDSASITSGALSVTASTIVYTNALYAAGGVVSFVIDDARVKATITDDGVNATGGVIAGVLTKDQVDVFIAKLEAQCMVEPTDICSYLGTVKAFMPMLFDLDLDGDGKKDAASMCWQFKLEAASITGLLPPGQ